VCVCVCVCVRACACVRNTCLIDRRAESLYAQQPDSDMALIWCIEHGVFVLEEAKKLFPQYQQAKARATELRRSRVRNAVTSPTASSPAAKKKARKSTSSKVVMPAGVSASDVGMSIGSGMEGIGVSGL